MENSKKVRTNFPVPVATPSAKVFRGIDEVKNVYRSMLVLGDQDIIYTFTHTENIDSDLKEWLEKEFEPKRIFQKISKTKFYNYNKYPEGEMGLYPIQ